MKPKPTKPKVKHESEQWTGSTKKEQHIIENCIGKVINRIVLGTGDGVIIWFEDGSQLKIIDEQDCCEERYFNTDDNEYLLQGEIFTGFEIKECDTVENEYGQLECQFLYINTDKDRSCIKCYNDHNGYYSGFNLTISMSKQHV